MAAGDPYIDCNNQKPTELILRDMIVQDAEGKPAFRVYGSGGGGGSTSFTSSLRTVTGGQITIPSGFVIGIFYNGFRLENTVGYNISGTTVTFTGNPDIEDGETVTVITAV